MPRVDLTVTSGTTQYPTAAVVVTMTAADTTNKERFVLTGKEILIIQNSGASPHTITITSTADPQGRTGDITTQSIAAGAIACLGPLALPGWGQAVGNYLHIEANHTEIKWGVYRMP